MKKSFARVCQVFILLTGALPFTAQASDPADISPGLACSFGNGSESWTFDLVNDDQKGRKVFAKEYDWSKAFIVLDSTSESIQVVIQDLATGRPGDNVVDLSLPLGVAKILGKGIELAAKNPHGMESKLVTLRCHFYQPKETTEKMPSVATRIKLQKAEEIQATHEFGSAVGSEKAE